MTTNKHLQLIRKTGFASVAAAKAGLEAAFSGDTFNAGEPALGITTNGEVVLGIKGDENHGSVFYNAATVDAAIAALETKLVGGASASADTFGEIETIINNMKAAEASYSVSKTTTGLPATVKERYNLTKTVGNNTITVGENIDIAKDSHIVSITYITTGEHAQNLEYVYIDASGNTQTTYVDMSELVLEAEFESGVTATNHIVHGVVDPTSEAFLTVGADGFKLSGVQTAINNAVAGLDAEESGSTTHVSVKVTEVDGKITDVTVNESDIASNTELDNEISYRKAVTGINGNSYTANTSANYISGATSMNDADVKLDAQVKANADAIADLEAAKVSVEKDVDSEDFLTVTANADETVYTIKIDGVQDAIDGAIEALSAATVGGAGKYLTSISETNGVITANAADLTASAVAASAISGDTTHVAITGTTVAAQIDSISQTLKSQEGAALTAVTAGNAAIEVGTKSNNAQSVSLVLGAGGATSDLLSIESDGLTISNVYDCGTW